MHASLFSATLLLMTTCMAAPGGNFIPPGGRKLVPVKNGSQASGTQGVKPREVDASSYWRNPLQKRLIKCSDGGYCPDTDFCDTVDGVKGCCPIGETCSSQVDGCADASYLPCTNYDFCCPLGSTCGLDSGGNAVCESTYYYDTTTTKRTTTTTKATTTTTPPAGTTIDVSETTTTDIEVDISSDVFSFTSVDIGTIPTPTDTPAATNPAVNSTSSAASSFASASAVTVSKNGGATITSREGYIFSITAVIFALNHLLVVA